MTVKELIKKLQTTNQDTIVVVSGRDHSYIEVDNIFGTEAEISKSGLIHEPYELGAPQNIDIVIIG